MTSVVLIHTLIKRCRSRKKRCIPSAAGLACRLCTSKGLRCDAPTTARISPDLPRPLTHIAPASQSSVSPGEHQDVSYIVENTLGNQVLCDELIDIYFRVIHYKQHLLFHHGSFLRHHQNSLVAPYLLLAIFALSARYVLPVELVKDVLLTREGFLPTLPLTRRNHRHVGNLSYERRSSPSTREQNSYRLSLCRDALSLHSLRSWKVIPIRTPYSAVRQYA